MDFEQYNQRHRLDANKYLEEFRQARRRDRDNRLRPLLQPDMWLLMALFLLLGLGLVMVNSSTLYLSLKINREATFFIGKQLFFAGCGLGLGLLLYLSVSEALLVKSTKILFALSLAMLIGTYLPGIGVWGKGAHRWLNLHIMQFQVSEFVKFALIVFTANFLVRQRRFFDHAPLQAVGSLYVICLPALLLLFLQPDLGSTILILGMMFFLLFLANVDWKLMANIALSGLAFVLLAILMKSYRKGRLFSFSDPFADAQGDGHQLVNSLIAIGGNGLDGRGLGESIQKYSFLSEGHNDFIFALIGEELGFWGMLAVLLLYCLVLWRCFVIARLALQVRRPFSAYYAYGLGTMMMMQVLIHTGSAIGAIPTKGLTLPLISYGGSSLLMTIIMFAVLLRLGSEASWQAEKEKKARERRYG